MLSLRHHQQQPEELHSLTTSSTNNNINNSHHDAQQNILIIDDAPSRNDSCFNFLKSKLLFRRLYHPLPFSTRFEKKDTIKRQFLLPYDVKLSHLNQCIVVSDSENESLRILDLESGEEKCTIKIGHVTRYLAIEMDKKKEKEYLYLSVESGFLYKFDLAELISDGIEGKPLRFVWKLGETNDEELELELPSCIAVSYSDKYKTENYQDENAIILVCDTGKNKLLMLASSDGSLIDSVSTFVPGHLVEEDDDYVDEDLQTSFRQPFGICLDHNEDIIISEHHAGMRANIHLLEKAGECFVTKKSLYTSFPTYVMFEPVKRYIFISEEGESMINIIDYEGNSVKRIKTFKDVGIGEEEATFEIPDGMCINDKTGELYLVDCEKNQLLIFN